MEAATNQSSSLSSFIDYKRAILTLVSALRRMRNLSRKLNLESSAQLIDDVLERIETDSFSIAVVGEFKRGKSTFINALLGQEILPSDVLPCSATLNRVTYGLKPLVKAQFKDGREETVAIKQLADYVTKMTPESEMTAAIVKEATVYYPTHFCQNNVDIIDTPGLSDDESMTEVTLSVLPHVDAAIMVILAQSPFSEVERDFLENKLLTNDLGRVIFVVTGIDRCNRSEDADRVVQLVKERIENHVLQRFEQQFGRESEEYKVYQHKIGKLQIFGLSSYQALQAKLSKDTALLAQSRFHEFEPALEKFLTQERGAILLQVPLNRAIASATEILKTTSIQESALQSKREDIRTTYEASVAEIAARRQENVEKTQHFCLAVEKLKQRLQPLLNHLEDELKQAAWQVINSTLLNSSEFKNFSLAVSMLRLDQNVSNGVEGASRKLAGKIQTEIRRSLVEEITKTKPNDSELNQVLNVIGMQFIDIANMLKLSIVQGRIASRIAHMTKSGLGGWLSQNLSSGEFKQTFKAKYEQAILAEIGKQLKLNSIKQKVSDDISKTFDVLKQKTQQKGDSFLDNTQNILTELRSKRDRGEIQVEMEYQKLSEIRTETQRILSNAKELSGQLIQVMDS